MQATHGIHTVHARPVNTPETSRAIHRNRLMGIQYNGKSVFRRIDGKKQGNPQPRVFNVELEGGWATKYVGCGYSSEVTSSPKTGGEKMGTNTAQVLVL